MIMSMPSTTTASKSTDAVAPQFAEPAKACDCAVRVAGVSHFYGSRQALSNLSLEIPAGQIFAVLGPNGGGKTTLFRLLSTLIPLHRGDVTIFGHDLRREQPVIRRLLGVVFQAPSLDRKLTVAENIRLQAVLYGIGRRELAQRLDELLTRFELRDRASERTERLSGGLRRRVELAKGMIHHPRLLLLDEPSTGLDPAARKELWQYLEQLRDEQQATIVLTTHYLDEADRANRIAIINEGQLVACGAPDDLRRELGGDSITIETVDGDELASAIRDSLGLPACVMEGGIRLEIPDGHDWISRIVEAFPGRISAIRLGKPTLEDVFIARTGHRFWRERAE
jgi:ABC-2 type transport system ATP-binding protein